MNNSTIYAFILGIFEFWSPTTTNFDSDKLLNAYDRGRELAHKLTFRQFEP